MDHPEIALFRRVARRQRGLAGGILLALAGCGSDFAVLRVDWNERIRLDREPLDLGNGAQGGTGRDQLAEDPGIGPYRRAVNDLVSPIVPAIRHADHLPQSECLWYASANLGSTEQRQDFFTLHWEAVVHLDPAVGVGRDLQHGDHDLTACRGDDAVLRLPPRDLDGRFVELDAGDLAPYTSDTFTQHPYDETRPGFLGDLVLLGARLWALPVEPEGGVSPGEVNPFPHRTCDIERTRLGEPIPVPPWRFLREDDREVLALSAPHDELGRIPLCSGAGGLALQPNTTFGTGLFQLVVTSAPASEETADEPEFLDSSIHPALRLTPRLVPAFDGGTRGFERQMAPTADGGFAWSTPIERRDGAGRSRWRENFTSSLRAFEVSFFSEEPGEVGRSFLDYDGVCIRDPHHADGATCRWHCTGPRSAGEVDLATSCREVATGTPEPVLATPTFAHDSLAQVALQEPLEWLVENPRLSWPLDAPPPAGPVFISFGLRNHIALAALTASRDVTDLGRAMRGEPRQGTFEVRNDGGWVVRVESVELDPTDGEPGDFALELPSDPETIPVPLDVTADADTGFASVEAGPDWDELPLIVAGESTSIVRVGPTRAPGSELAIDGEVVRFVGAHAFRDDPEARFEFRPAVVGQQRPLRRLVWARRSLPFLLEPGESFPVLVTGTPSALGSRSAAVRVEGVSLADPSQRPAIVARVAVTGLTGPLPSMLPAIVRFPAPALAPSAADWRRTVRIVNDGDLPLTVQSIAVVRPPLAPPGDFDVLERPPAGVTVASGQSEAVVLEHRPACNWDGTTVATSAELRVSTAHGTVTTALVGLPSECP